MVSLIQTRPVAHQPSGRHKFRELIDCRHAFLRRQVHDALFVLNAKSAWEHDKSVYARLDSGLEHTVQGFWVWYL